MKAVLINYNFTPNWIKNTDYDYLIYDRSESDEWLKDFPQERIIKTKNVGNVDYDRLGYLVDHYDSLPDYFLWSKSNLFNFITHEEWETVKHNTTFTPLLTQHHKTYSDAHGKVCFYAHNMYHERNDSWYVGEMSYKYFRTYQDFARSFSLPSPEYLPFAPGGNYILTRETVHKYSRDFYQKLRSILPYCQLPAEAHMVERSYFTIWR